MTDAELVYSLYVQTDPIPDPGLLPLTLGETELRTVERSEVMDTQPQIEAPRRRRRGLAIAVGAVVVVAAVAGIGLWIANSGDELVAAADAYPEITFDGSTCVYEGPARIEQGTMSVTVVNSSAETAGAVGWLLKGTALTMELERTPVGTDMPLAPGELHPSGAMSFYVEAAGGRTVTEPTTVMAPGTHLIDCVTWSGGDEDHVWRPASIEVVAPS